MTVPNTTNSITNEIRGTSSEDRGLKKPVRSTKKTKDKPGRKKKGKGQASLSDQVEEAEVNEQIPEQQTPEQIEAERPPDKSSEKLTKIAIKVEEGIRLKFGHLITTNKNLSLSNKNVVKTYSNDGSFDTALVEYSQKASDHVFANYELYEKIFPDFTEGTTSERLTVAGVIYKKLKEGAPPAFTDKLTPQINLRYIDATMLCHEAFHLYSAQEFKNILGKEIDEGMTQYLTEIVMKDIRNWYMREGWEEGVDYIGSQQDYYKKQNEKVNSLISIGGEGLKEKMLNAFFMGTGLANLQMELDRQ